jgi:hypothetical protein
MALKVTWAVRKRKSHSAGRPRKADGEEMAAVALRAVALVTFVTGTTELFSEDMMVECIKE